MPTPPRRLSKRRRRSECSSPSRRVHWVRVEVRVKVRVKVGVRIWVGLGVLVAVARSIHAHREMAGDGGRWLT